MNLRICRETKLMFITIAKKEFLDNLLNLRFSIGLLFAVVLTVTCVVLQSGDYAERMQDYHENLQIQQKNIEKYGPITTYFIETPIRCPQPLNLIAIGLFGESDMQFFSNFIPSLFPFIDLVFVVSVIMSLLGLLFSYDSICGEKENGTLKLICSNSLSKGTVLFGKWIGGTASLLIPFLISIILAAIYLALDKHVMWSISDWSAFSLVILASMTYISLFYLMGMMVSTLSRSSSESILKAILLWVLIVLIVPGMSLYVSSELYPIPSLVRIKKEYNQIQLASQNKTGIMKKLEDGREQIDKRYEDEYGDLFREYKAIPREQVLDRTGMEAPESDLKEMGLTYRQDVRNLRDEIFKDFSDNMNKLQKQIEIETERQTEVAGNLSAVSPYADYLYLSSELSATGLESARDYKRVVKEYYDIANKYSDKKHDEKNQKRISDFKNLRKSPLDISDRPRFNYEAQPLIHRLTSSLPYWGVILFYGVVFFAISFVAFIRYDPR